MPDTSSCARCSWAEADPLMRDYHDAEWGVPQQDPRMLWEMLMLEGFQAGLSWITILRKRDAFRTAFANFDPVKVAAFGERDVEQLTADPGIVRHGPRSKPRSRARKSTATCRSTARISRRSAGPSQTERQSSAMARAGLRARPCRKQSPRNSSGAVSSSSGRPSPTHGCRRSASSTIILSTAFDARLGPRK